MEIPGGGSSSQYALYSAVWPLGGEDFYMGPSDAFWGWAGILIQHDCDVKLLLAFRQALTCCLQRSPAFLLLKVGR